MTSDLVTRRPAGDAHPPRAGAASGANDARPAKRIRKGKGTGGYDRRPGFWIYGLLGAVLLGSVFPIWWSFLIGSHDASAINAPGMIWLPGGNFIENAMKVIDGIPFWTALMNSIIVSTAVSLSVVLFSTLAGYSFAKLRFRGREGLLVFVIATMAVPTQLGIVPLFIVMSNLGWTGSLWAVIAPSLVTAFGVFWMTQYLRDALPDELIEAARMDGASMIRTFWHIGLPAARPAAAMLALFTFVSTWTNFFWPFIVLDPGNPTLPVALQQLQAAFYVDYSLVLAGVVLSIIPLILVFIFLGKQLVSGIMQGAVKG